MLYHRSVKDTYAGRIITEYIGSSCSFFHSRHGCRLVRMSCKVFDLLYLEWVPFWTWFLVYDRVRSLAPCSRQNGYWGGQLHRDT